ncbi:MAG: serine hydroxymethyltransferase [Chloroflexi bacterium]|nr:serine hydroxymethyltransferase [Chloroflexota bacterium]MCY3937370.1 serine hydroxymethyltransferase [Chloroflexota bacterium]
MKTDGHFDLRRTDPDVFASLKSEEQRQLDGLELIASENYTSAAVMQAVGSVFTNKYAEGYPGKRYYGGCVNVDEIERLAIQRAKDLFGAEHANVQAHSGSAPNMAVYFAALEYGDTVLGMELAHGGHLTHGHPKNFSGSQYNFAAYGVDSQSERIDYDAVRSIALKVKPKLIVCGYTAYPRTIDFAAFREIADEAGSLLMADIAHIAGLVVGGAHPSPVPFCDFVTTSTHKTLRGPRGGLVLCRREFARAVDSAIFPGTQGGPLMHVIAGKAVALKEAGMPEFAGYAARVVENARALAEGLTEEGLRLVSGGTDNHLMLIDFGPDGASGRAMQIALERAGITANKNTVPRETRKPTVTSGIRLGTPALTTRGFGPAEMRRIAGWIRRVYDDRRDRQNLAAIRAEVREMALKFPVPGLQSPVTSN